MNTTIENETLLFPPSRLTLVGAITPILRGTSFWEKRFEIEWYVARCELAGFCSTDDMRRACAERYIAGKRKVSPPGTRKRKEEIKRTKRLLETVPPDLSDAVKLACETPAAIEYRNGNEKAINSLVGFVLKRYKTDPAAVRTLLISSLT